MAQAATASAGSETKRRPLTNFVLASYGAPAAPLALSGLPIAVYLPVIYADSDGFALSLGVVGLLIGLSRISDVVTDPLIGYLSDRWKTRWGRRKPWVLIGTPIFAAGMWLLFMPPFEFSDVTVFGATFSNGYIWLFAMLTLFYIGSTVKDLPFSAWGAELSNEYHERTLIMSWKEGLGVFGSLVSSFIPLFILFFGEVKPTDAVFWLVLVMCISMPIVNLNCLIVVPEWRVVEQPSRIGVFEGLKIVVKNKPYMILVIVFALGAVGSAMTNSLSLFFVKHVMQVGEIYGAYLAPYFVCQVAAIPLWFKLSRRIGKHKTIMWAIGWYSLWSLFIPLVMIAPTDWFSLFELQKYTGFLSAEFQVTASTYLTGVESGKLPIYLVVMCLKGSAIGALSAIPFAMCADVVDVDTVETGQRRAGAYMAIWSMVKKGAYALGTTIGLALVVYWGFDSLAEPRETTNTQFSLLMLACTYSVIPALIKFASMPFLLVYPLTEERLHEVQAEIRRKHSIGGSEGLATMPAR